MVATTTRQLRWRQLLLASFLTSSALAFGVAPTLSSKSVFVRARQPKQHSTMAAVVGGAWDPEVHFLGEDDDDEYEPVATELWQDEESTTVQKPTEDDWLPDREKARLRKQQPRQTYGEATAESSESSPSAFTEEEEEVIAAMGGRHSPKQHREPGYLGDSTLEEIATDYSVPICYVADVLCSWGVTPPINGRDMLGDLVTGEQAFALLEAVHTLDMGALHDRYSNTNLQQICFEWDIDIQKGFEMAVQEGWNLPFGVQTCLRVEQEDEMIRVLGNPMLMARDGVHDDEENYYD